MPLVAAFDWEPVSFDLAQPMNVKVTPYWPGPSDEIVATVSGWASDPYLLADSVDLQVNGTDIKLDIHWGSHPAQGLADTALAFSGSGVVYEPIQLGPGYGGQSTRYQVSKSLGKFSPGTYELEVNNSGVLTGTVSVSFTVRDLPSYSIHLLGSVSGW